MLEVKGITVHYGKFRAVSDVSLTVRPGRLTALLGANGAGKSTTLRAISGLLACGTGSITFDGRRIDNQPAHRITRLGVVHVPEGRGALPNITVEENLRMGAFGRADTAGIKSDRDKVFGYFPILRTRLHEPSGVLSGGEQQMLSLARVMLKAPRVLMIDEMSLGLAPKITGDIMQVVRDLVKNGMAVLCVEQRTDLILRYADYGYVLMTGKNDLEGSGQELRGHDGIVRAYLGRQPG